MDYKGRQGPSNSRGQDIRRKRGNGRNFIKKPITNYRVEPACCTQGPGSVTYYYSNQGWAGNFQWCISSSTNGCKQGAVPSQSMGNCSNCISNEEYQDQGNTCSRTCYCDPDLCDDMPNPPFPPGPPGGGATTPVSTPPSRRRTGGLMTGRMRAKNPRLSRVTPSVPTPQNRDYGPSCCRGGGYGTWTCQQIGSGWNAYCAVEDNCTQCGDIPVNYLDMCDMNNYCGGGQAGNTTYNCVRKSPDPCCQCTVGNWWIPNQDDACSAGHVCMPVEGSWQSNACGECIAVGGPSGPGYNPADTTDTQESSEPGRGGRRGGSIRNKFRRGSSIQSMQSGRSGNKLRPRPSQYHPDLNCPPMMCQTQNEDNTWGCDWCHAYQPPKGNFRKGGRLRKGRRR